MAPKVTPAGRRKRFLEILQQTGNVSRAAREAGLSRQAVYARREKDTAFAAAWEEALASALDDLEEVLLARAREGVDKPVHFQGRQVVGTVRTYSDQLAMFLLKARRPDVFSDAETGMQSKAGLRHARQELDRKLARLVGGSQA